MYQSFGVVVDGLTCMTLVDHTVASHKEICMTLGIFDDYIKEINAQGAIGGVTEEDSKKHLLTRFLNSAARTQVIACIEEPSCQSISFEVLGLLQEGHIYLIDIAAGNGAGTISILNTICKMREDGVLPTDSLDVEIHAIDYSSFSLSYYEKLLESLKETYQKFGINVSLLKHQIDITNDIEVKTKIEKIKDSVISFPQKGVGSDPRYLLICSAISGVKKNIFLSQFSNSYETIAKSFQEKNSAFLWVEPLSKKNWLPLYWEQFMSRLEITSSQEGDEESYMVKQSYNWMDPYISKPIPTSGDYCLMSLGQS